MIISRDDPVVPIKSFKSESLPDNVQTIITNEGGHLGFIAQRNCDPDSLWLDWRVLDWVQHQNKVDNQNQSLSCSG